MIGLWNAVHSSQKHCRFEPWLRTFATKTINCGRCFQLSSWLVAWMAVWGLGNTKVHDYNMDFITVHYCWLVLSPRSSPLLLLSPKTGSKTEVNKTLEKFNINTNAFPATTEDGTVSCDCLNKYLARMRKEEEHYATTREGVIVQPLYTDVILGRGRHQQEHAGNLQLAVLVDENRIEYFSRKKNQKSRLIRGLVEDFESSGGRFLERTFENEKVIWVLATKEAGREKVSQLFRTQTKRNSMFFASGAEESKTRDIDSST